MLYLNRNATNRTNFLFLNNWMLFIGGIFACLFDDNLWKSFVCQTTFSNVKYQDLCATINPSKIKYLQEPKNNL